MFQPKLSHFYQRVTIDTTKKINRSERLIFLVVSIVTRLFTRGRHSRSYQLCCTVVRQTFIELSTVLRCR